MPPEAITDGDGMQNKRVKPSNGQVETIIGSSPENKIVAPAVITYLQQLETVAYPDQLPSVLSSLPGIDLHQLRPVFQERVTLITHFTSDIIAEINQRSAEINGPIFQRFVEGDRSMWQTSQSEGVLFGILGCVDKGIPHEAMVGVDGNFGRTLAGDIDIYFLAPFNQFRTPESALVKRLIHLGRQGYKTGLEILLEHTVCGRRGQILKNEGGYKDIPRIQKVVDHIEALADEFGGTPEGLREQFTKLRQCWNAYDRQGTAVLTPDGGVWAGIIYKVAQRQALNNEDIARYTKLFLPIELYDKRNGDLFAGLDAIDVLTDKRVMQAGGYTDEVLASLAESGNIFSLAAYMPSIQELLQNASGIAVGTMSYEDLQKKWLLTLKQLQTLTGTLWDMYQPDASNDKPIRAMVDAYVEAATGHMRMRQEKPELYEAVRNRLIHHLFHVVSYAYLLDTFGKGHPPGTHHIEDHLATGDHEIGTKRHLALGQGDLERPSATEMYTGYTVLLHSVPGKQKQPIVVMIKLDTDRPSSESLSTEESNVAAQDFREFLNLWPYFLVGDIIPILAIRDKKQNGISRLGGSVVLSFQNIVALLERDADRLPPYVPATTTNGEIVFVPAVDVVATGIATASDLGAFREQMQAVADSYANPAVQESFTVTMSTY